MVGEPVATHNGVRVDNDVDPFPIRYWCGFLKDLCCRLGKTNYLIIAM